MAAVASLVLSPLFQYTNGRAWNHALPTLLTVAALWVQLAARRSDRPTKWLASGGLLGIAAGARASSLTAILPFALFALGVDRPPGEETGPAQPGLLPGRDAGGAGARHCVRGPRPQALRLREPDLPAAERAVPSTPAA